ncbi:hypothetical protein CAMSH0001_0179 [Campylobacter showae RM3277]|uniref:Uncharacterized protein n=1 Tax=Campylobacter showae RM3277 TaxID=553219 RepID=C6RJ76_9BACT|nr:hypothetical protein CAMSH0001_0179 [Campylobacter showae RM3277]
MTKFKLLTLNLRRSNLPMPSRQILQKSIAVKFASCWILPSSLNYSANLLKLQT